MTLSTTRHSQSIVVGQLSQKKAALEALKIRYQQAAVTDWHGLNQKKTTFGDPVTLPTLLRDIQQNMIPSMQLLVLPTPSTDLPSLEASLSKARQVMPGITSKLERQAGEFLAMKESYLQASREVVDEVTVPKELTAHIEDLDKRYNALSAEILILKRRRDDMHAKKEQTYQLRAQLQVLPPLKQEIDDLNKDLSQLETASKQGKLYNQILDSSRQYLEQTQPEHCPVCKQSITNLGGLVERLRSETPADVAQLSRDYDLLRKQLIQKQASEQELVNQKSKLAKLEEEIASLPTDLEEQITYRQDQSDQVAKEMSEVKIEISQIEARIQQASEKRRQLENTIRNIKSALGKASGPNLPEELDLAAVAVREQAANISSIDFQPISDQIDHARKLLEMEEEEKRLRKQLEDVLAQVKNALGLTADDDISGGFEKAIDTLLSQINEIQTMDFQPVASDLARANQLQQIQNEEDR